MNLAKVSHLLIKHNVRDFINSFKQLQGKPHYVSIGMAVGIFVSLTPLFPFQTPVAIALAFIAGGSKRAAAIGVWLSNPITLPFCYFASYKVGQFLLGTSSPFNESCQSISEILRLGVDVFYTMMAGGSVLGLISAVAAYFITHKAVAKSKPTTQ